MTEEYTPAVGKPETPQNTNGIMRQILFFDTMLTPKIITIVYWLMLAGVTVSALGIMVASNLFAGLITLLFGALGVRIWCELMIVLFKINQNIQKMADRN